MCRDSGQLLTVVLSLACSAPGPDAGFSAKRAFYSKVGATSRQLTQQQVSVCSSTFEPAAILPELLGSLICFLGNLFTIQCPKCFPCI